MSRSKFEISEKNKKYFLERRNAKFEKKEFYKIIIDTSYCDATDIMEVTTLYMQNQHIGVYAVKDKTGIHEMVTEKAVTMFGVGDVDSLYCCGLIPCSCVDLIQIDKDLTFLDDNLELKKQYIDRLLSLSNEVYKYCERGYRETEVEEQKKESALQYLKSYKIPRN